jgi:hypothetical protein
MAPRTPPERRPLSLPTPPLFLALALLCCHCGVGSRLTALGLDSASLRVRSNELHQKGRGRELDFLDYRELYENAVRRAELFLV